MPPKHNVDKSGDEGSTPKLRRSGRRGSALDEVKEPEHVEEEPPRKRGRPKKPKPKKKVTLDPEITKDNEVEDDFIDDTITTAEEPQEVQKEEKPHEKEKTPEKQKVEVIVNLVRLKEEKSDSPPKVRPEKSVSPKIKQVKSDSPPKVRPEKSVSPKIKQEKSDSPLKVRPEKSVSPKIKQVKSDSPPKVRPEKSVSPKIKQVKSDFPPKVRPEKSVSPKIKQEKSDSPLKVRPEKSVSPKIIEENIKVEDEDSCPSSPEDDKIKIKDSLEHYDTEMVSEDEFPSDGPKAPLDTEAVSDEELPGPTQVELLDTEAVSEDELPPVKKKRKHRGHSPDSFNISDLEYEKDVKRSRDSESPLSRKDKDRSRSGSLPELEKYWKKIKEDPMDFTGWTYLLQYIDQENDIEAARSAYDKFLSHYPYCYGYWRKYADYERRKGGESNRCEQVFERGLTAIPLSVDLWLHYLNYCKSTTKDEEKLRIEYDRAIEQCGLEFRSDRLWDSYIKWEIENKNYQNAYCLYIKLLSTPTQGYKTHFETFENFVRNHHPSKMLKVDEFLQLRTDVVHKIKEKGLPVPEPPSAAPPGDESAGEELEKPFSHADEETAILKERVIAKGKKIFNETVSEVIARWSFEERIKRPYFHVKPLEKCQLYAWRDYLDYEIGTDDEKRTKVLFERCLIACALYEEFWVKYIRYLESLPGDREEEIRKVYRRACLTHHPNKPYLALNWATFEESHNNLKEARRALTHIDKEVPNMMLVALRRINLERRAGNLEEACKMFEFYLGNAKARGIVVTLSVKYSRFCWKICNDPGKGIEVIKKAIEKHPDDIRLYVQLLDLLMLQPNINENECVAIFDRIIEREGMDIEDKLIFAQRRIEFLQDFGSKIDSVQKAQSEYFSVMKQMEDLRKPIKKTDDKIKSDDKKKDSSHNYSSTYTSPSSNYSSYQGSGHYSQQSYGQPSQNNSYSSNDQNYQNYYSQSNYGNGSQSWGGYNYYS